MMRDLARSTAPLETGALIEQVDIADLQARTDLVNVFRNVAISMITGIM
jgi:hypothetical protein